MELSLRYRFHRYGALVSIWLALLATERFATHSIFLELVLNVVTGLVLFLLIISLIRAIVRRDIESGRGIKHWANQARRTAERNASGGPALSWSTIHILEEFLDTLEDMKGIGPTEEPELWRAESELRRFVINQRHIHEIEEGINSASGTSA